MTVAGVDVCAERLEVEVDLPRRMRAVDDRERARGASARAQRRDVVDAAAQPFDVRAEHEARARPGIELCERAAHEHGAGASRDELPEELHPAVLGIAEQHFVSGLQVERADDRVQRRARVRRECEILGSRADVGGELRPRPVEALRKAPLERHELDRLALELTLKPLVRLEHGLRARAERPVIEKDDRRVEEEQILHSS